MDTDPLAGRFGTLVLTVWTAEAPTGRDEAFLMLTTPDPRAPQTMPLVADVLGFARGYVEPQPISAAVIELQPDGWAALVVGDQRIEVPVAPEWADTARAHQMVVLAVGRAPKPAGMSAEHYLENFGGRALIGLAPVTVR